jgi:[FeFe] hydrogenase H-cluster maturation GTPase HydF
VAELHQLFVSLADHIERERPPLEGLVSPGDQVMLVTPIDNSAPKGRLILPQVEVLRDLLDKDCTALVTKEFQLPRAYASLVKPPELVITDSQAFGYIKDLLPPEQPLTSFSILFARKKGDLSYFTESLKALKDFPPGEKVLVLEACNHHRMDDDIGTVKIPRIFRQKVQKDTHFDLARTLPTEEELRSYALVISCAGCMVTRNVMMRHISILRKLRIPALNYGMFFAWANGLFPRALLPIPSAALLLQE